MFIYTYLKEYFILYTISSYSWHYPIIGMLCYVVARWQGNEGMPGGDIHQRYFECRWPVTERTRLLTVISTTWVTQKSCTWDPVLVNVWDFRMQALSLLSISSLLILKQKVNIFDQVLIAFQNKNTFNKPQSLFSLESVFTSNSPPITCMTKKFWSFALISYQKLSGTTNLTQFVVN